MAARGTESKNQVFTKLIEVYPNAFWEDEGKILRIPMNENGDVIEIKVTLTAAKNILGTSGSFPISAFNNDSDSSITTNTANINSVKESIEPTQEEKDNVSKLLASLGL